MDYSARHKGIVTAVSNDATAVDLRLVDDAADCGGCALRGVCGPHDDKNSVVVTASVANPLCPPSIGTVLEIGLPDNVRWLSTILLLMIPIAIFVTSLLGVIAIYQSETKAVVTALIAIAVYYIILIPLRGRLARRSRWQIIS